MRAVPMDRVGWQHALAHRGLVWWGALAVIGTGLAWTIVHQPFPVGATILISAIGLTTWLLFPTSPIYVLALLCPFELVYRVGALRDVRLHDALLIVLSLTAGISVLVRPQRFNALKAPFAKAVIVLWTFLLVWGAVSFLDGPANQWLLQGPLENTWYVYRAVGRALLFFPVLIFCLEGRESLERVIDAILLTSTGVALYAIWEAQQTGMNPSGPFTTKNGLAGFLVLVTPLVLGRLLGSNRRAHHILYGGAALVLLRALWLSGSRGGLVAALAAILAIGMLMPRRRLLAVALGGILGFCLLVAARPDLADRPMFRRFATLARPAEVQNLRWRQEQWQLFLDRLEERPFLGTGSEVDSSLYAMGRAGTTHSGYLGVAVRAGIPLLIAWLLLLGSLGYVCVRAAVQPVSSERRAFWIGMVGFLVALLVHNLVENTLAMPQIQQLFWTLLAIVLLERAGDESSALPAGAMRA